MENIKEYANQLLQLIDERDQLEDKLRRTEEWLKLAICVNGVLPFRTIQNVDKDYYEWFMANTQILNSGLSNGGMRIAFANPVDILLNRETSIREITKEELDRIFNGEKIYE